MRVNKKKKVLLIIYIIILILLIFVYAIIIRKHIFSKKWAEDVIKISKNNEEQVFKVEKLILCSSAGAVDKSQDKKLKDLNLYQYTDIAVYLNNGEELTNKNTIKELYIDNISLEGNDEIGRKSLMYKNLLAFGSRQDIEDENKDKKDDIKFNIVNTNEENEKANYNKPTFYTDCSNPITLQYVNSDIVTGYKMNENNQVAFNGSILKAAGVKVEDLECKVKFKINIINNQNEKYSCFVNFKIPLDDIFEGTTMKGKTTTGDEYVFFREQ